MRKFEVEYTEIVTRRVVVDADDDMDAQEIVLACEFDEADSELVAGRSRGPDRCVEASEVSPPRVAPSAAARMTEPANSHQAAGANPNGHFDGSAHLPDLPTTDDPPRKRLSR